ncbi:hypothetical protein MKZ38_000672 [Zalerion maritima]|uniref:Uncharacterized protein n=1 Tax=Zalerion maritima TaxID=339359 RepID=A0AAD5WRX4_9PEZI|nr:hypothetical protein MKZ38_000672 [Zalerion maritima]
MAEPTAESGPSGDARKWPAEPKPKLPVPKIRPPQEKLASVAFASVDEFFSPEDPLNGQTETEIVQQRIKSTDDMGHIVCNRIRGAYDMETRRIAAEAEVGEEILRNHGILSGAWEVDDQEADRILANMAAEPIPNVDYRKRFKDFEIKDEAPKPKCYAARINEILLENIIEGDSNVLGFMNNHLPVINAQDAETLRLIQIRRDVERQVQQQGHGYGYGPGGPGNNSRS